MVSHYEVVFGIFTKCGCEEAVFKAICTEVDEDPQHDWIKACKTRFDSEKLRQLENQMKKYPSLNTFIESSSNDGMEVHFRKGLNDIKKLLEYCKAFGINDKVCFDPTLSFRLGYYTGMIIEAVYTPCCGNDNKVVQLAAGGRYDKMVEKIDPNHSVPCVGFTINIEEIFRELSNREEAPLKSVRIRKTEVFVASKRGCLTERMKLCDRLWKSNIKAEFFYNHNLTSQEQLQYCKKHAIPFCILIIKAGEMLVSDPEELLKDDMVIDGDNDAIQADYDAVVNELKRLIKEREDPLVIFK